MLNVTAFANAASAVMVVFYIACALLSYVAPDLLFGLARSWMHTVNLEAVKATFVPDLGLLLYGFITAVALTWVTAYAVVWLYNRWAK
ncbi:hypothetical protein HYZ05_00750 [Candidatus Daviesbacteria bacterium]|nr:hypothetical protein [Candidatus Daviesbacteria bacterium]